MKFLVVNDVNNSTMNDAQGVQNNANTHYTVYGDLNIFEGDPVEVVYLRVIGLALIVAILALIVRILEAI